MSNPEDFGSALVGAIDQLDKRETMAKAHFIGGVEQPSNVKPVEIGDGDEKLFSKAGALAPPYGPEMLCKVHEHSNSLRQNVDAYSVNIDGFGHRFEPVIDLDGDDTEQQVSDAIFLERLEEQHAEGDEEADAPIPTSAEVNERIEIMRSEMRLEKAKLDTFFRFCSDDHSFIKLRMRTREDTEIIGNGFWEIVRNVAGEPAQFNYIPGFTVRLLPKRAQLVPVTRKVKRSPFTYSEYTAQKRFRKFVQVFEGCKVYFKEYGDPRVMSAQTGTYYKTPEAMQVTEGGDENADVAQATELMHFAVESPRSPYGIPRWIGALLSVLGSRQAEEVNFLYFQNKSVPPLAVLVSGGRLGQDSVKRLEDYVENRIKGRENFHKILVIEAEPASGGALADDASGRMKIELVPLTNAQHGDALFQKYDERNIDKVGMTFRLPRMLRGDIRDFNRSTADAALEFAETQVFSPEREDFDWQINRTIMAELGIKFWTFASNSPTSNNPMDLTEMVTTLSKAGLITPEEAREIIKSIFNKDFKKIDDVWARIPLEVLKAGFIPEDADFALPPEPDKTEPDEIEAADVTTGNFIADGGAKVPGQGKKKKGFQRLPAGNKAKALRKLARDLIDLRGALDTEEKNTIAETFKAERIEEMEREVIQIPAAEFKRLIGDV